MPAAPLACTVRECNQPLTRGDRTWTCRHGHSFDIARRGYVNLLQPNDRRSLDAGDSRAAVEARARLLAAGIGQEVFDQVVEDALRALGPEPGGVPLAAPAAVDVPVVVDLGSGAGGLLRAVAARRPIIGIGIDLSTAAAEHAARQAPDITWVVANADRRLPLLTASVDLVLSQQGRRNPAECARVLKPGGRLLVSVPAADDLVELRGAVQGAGGARQRMDTVIAEHAACFTAVARREARQHQGLDRAALLDLLTATYRGARQSAAPRIEQLDRLDVTLAADLCLFAPLAR